METTVTNTTKPRRGKMKKWILTTAIITIVILFVVLSGCSAGLSVGPHENPYGNANLDIKQIK